MIRVVTNRRVVTKAHYIVIIQYTSFVGAGDVRSQHVVDSSIQSLQYISDVWDSLLNILLTMLCALNICITTNMTGGILSH